MKQFPLKELLTIVFYPLLFLIICWIIFLSDGYLHLNLYRFGVKPRTLDGLVGIICAPFIHGDINHILNNSLPVLILGAMIFYFYKPIAWHTVIWIYIISGFWLWVGGRNNDVIPNFHFGASTLIYGFATFLFFSGVFRRHKQLMMVSAFVVFSYGSITWGIFPLDRTISWEGHLFGSISGILVAYSYRHDGPQAVKYEWTEDEVDLEAEYQRQLEIEKLIEEEANKSSNTPYNIIYHYKENESENKL